MTAKTMYFAARTQVDLVTGGERIARQFSLPPFDFEVEFEGKDGWEYVTSKNAKLKLNMTKILEYHEPGAW